MATIVVVDPFNRSASHAPFNSAFLEVVRAAYPDDRLIFAAEPGHLEAVAELVDDSIDTETVAIEPAPRTAGFWSRLPREIQNLRIALNRCPEGPIVLIVCDITPATLYAIRWVLGSWSRRVRTALCILHSNANEIVAWRARNPLTRLRQLREAILRTLHPNLHYLVLEEVIRKTLLRELPELAGALHGLAHPIASSEPAAYAGLEAPGQCEPPVQVCFLGAATERKGFGTFLRIARRVASGSDGAIRFHALGWRPESEPDEDLGVLTTLPQTTYLPREEFRRKLARMHYVVLTLPPEIYGLSASGTLMDAIAAGKPVLALRARMLEEIFNSTNEPAGFLFDSEADLAGYLLSLYRIEGLSETWLRQAAAMRTLRATRMSSELASELKRILSRR
ncbi:MAG: glycosyltransferase [Betaproteobacteria bacterium]|nr:glycosyltransferase [Betaproteobacteria bacterium]